MECTICSLMSVLFSFIYNVLSAALDYPLLLFAISFLISLLILTNIQSARMICDLSGKQGRQTAVPCPTSQEQSSKSAPSFNYGVEKGPHTWSTSDQNQSPIDIAEECVQKFPIHELLTWNHYDDMPSCVWLKNNGHTVILRATFSGNTPTISGADLLVSYTFVELCFRWSQVEAGSEHSINHRRYPLEMQAMHRTGLGRTTSSYNVLQVAYLFDISAYNVYLDPVIQNLHRVRQPGGEVEIPPFPLAYLCHQFRNNFYSYGGSLTEPPCYEGVEWFIHPEPLAISQEQLEEFRQLLGSDRCTPILRNARPVQCIGGRAINLNEYRPRPCPAELLHDDSSSSMILPVNFNC